VQGKADEVLASGHHASDHSRVLVSVVPARRQLNLYRGRSILNTSVRWVRKRVLEHNVVLGSEISNERTSTKLIRCLNVILAQTPLAHGNHRSPSWILCVEVRRFS